MIVLINIEIDYRIVLLVLSKRQEGKQGGWKEPRKKGRRKEMNEGSEQA